MMSTMILPSVGTIPLPLTGDPVKAKVVSGAVLPMFDPRAIHYRRPALAIGRVRDVVGECGAGFTGKSEKISIAAVGQSS